MATTLRAKPEAPAIGVGELYGDRHPNPLVRQLPTTWTAKPTRELEEAEGNLAKLLLELSILDEEIAVAREGGEVQRVLAGRRRGEELPMLIEIAEADLCRLRIQHLEASRELIGPHAERFQAQAEAKREQIEALQAEVRELEDAMNELDGQRISFAHRIAETRKRLEELRPPPVRRSSKYSQFSVSSSIPGSRFL